MKKICTELSESSKEKGFTMRANLNADCIKALKRWNKEDAKKISEAIKTGNVKNAINHLENAKNRNTTIRKITSDHTKIIYLNGKMWGVFEVGTRKCFQCV